MSKRGRFSWMVLLVVPLFIILSWPMLSMGLQRTSQQQEEVLNEEVLPDPYESFSSYLVEENRSLVPANHDGVPVTKTVKTPWQGETLSIKLADQEHPARIERKWNLPFVSLQQMTEILNYELFSSLDGKVMQLTKTTEEGTITAVIEPSSLKVLTEFKDEKLYQKEVHLLGETYLNDESQLMIPLKDLLELTALSAAFEGGDIMEVTPPAHGSAKMQILTFFKDNEEKEKSGYYADLLKEQEPKELSFILLGDMALGTSLGRRNPFDEKWKELGGEHFLSFLKKDFDAADLVITNLENVFTDRSAYQPGKQYTYKAHRIEYLDVLKEGGITHVNVVNNHMVDFLQGGFDDTLEHLDDYGIEYFGTNLMKTDNHEIGNIETDSYSVFEKDGFKVGMLGYLGFNSSFVSDHKILSDIKMLKEVEKVDYIIAAMHWGGQNTYEVTWKQKEMGRKLIDYGVDLVYGNHPHVLQEVEIYEGKPIYYSLGNFLFIDYKSAKDPDGVMVKVNLTKDGFGRIKETFTHTPILWSGDAQRNDFTPKHMKDLELIRRTLEKLKITTTNPMEFR